MLQKGVMVGQDFHRKLSKMSLLKSKPSGESWPTSKSWFISHLSTTHVPAKTYIYDSDAKAETKDRFILTI